MLKSLLLLLLAAATPALAQSTAPSPPFYAWAKTPPMGWNSYDCFGGSVTEAEVRANAQYMKDHLLAHGWNTVAIDFRWYDAVSPDNDSRINTERLNAKLFTDDHGRLLPAPNRFPSAAETHSFKPLADDLHAMGMKFGFHMMRGIPRQDLLAATPPPIANSTFTAADAGDPADKCKWCPDMFGVRDNAAGQAWYESIFALYASWGLDFIKIDDLSAPYHAPEIAMIRRAIDKCGRPIILSTSPGETPVKQAADIAQKANMWRISGDFWDRWKNLDKQFDLLHAWHDVAAPGRFPDADMIPFGHIGIRSTIAGPDRRCRLTPTEQQTLMTLWALAPSPLMLGGNLPDNDDATLALLTNDDVLAVNQDPLVKPAALFHKDGTVEIWVRPLSEHRHAIGLFNRGNVVATATLDLAAAGLPATAPVHDLWTHKDWPIGVAPALPYTPSLSPHGSMLLMVHDLP